MPAGGSLEQVNAIAIHLTGMSYVLFPPVLCIAGIGYACKYNLRAYPIQKPPKTRPKKTSAPGVATLHLLVWKTFPVLLHLVKNFRDPGKSMKGGRITHPSAFNIHPSGDNG